MPWEGSEALHRFAWEAVPGVTPWNAEWHDSRFNSETLAANLPLIQPNSLRGGRQRSIGLPSKITAGGQIAVDLEPEGHGYYLAAFQKGGDTPQSPDGGAATATLTFGANAGNGETVTIGGRVYTFQTVLTNVAGNVFIGVSASASLDNLIAAINKGAGGGTTYAASTVAHPYFTAAAGAGDTLVITATTGGIWSHAIDLSTDVVSASWGAPNPAGGTQGVAFRHKLAPSLTTKDYDKTFSERISRNNRLPQLSPGCLSGGFGIVTGIQSVITAALQVVAQRASYWDMATVVIENNLGTTTRPVLRGSPKYAVASAADADLYVEVTNASGIIKVKIGSSGTLTSNQTMTAAAWNTLLYNDGTGDVPIGDPDDPVQLYVPDFTNWTVGGTPDAWKFKFNNDDLEVPWVSSFPEIEELNEIHASLTVDGEEVFVTQLTLNSALTIDPNFHIGGRYSSLPALEAGLRSYSGQLERKQIDNDLLLRLLAGQEFALDVIITSRVNISTSDIPYRIRFVMPLCMFSGQSPSVPGPGILQEPLPFDCYPDPTSELHPDEMTIYLDNSVADMTV